MNDWTSWARWAGAAAFGAWMYHAGKKAALCAALKKEKRENEKVDKILAAHAGFDRGECLKRLRGGKK